MVLTLWAISSTLTEFFVYSKLLYENKNTDFMFGFAANNDEYDLKLSRLIIGNFVLALQ